MGSMKKIWIAKALVLCSIALMTSSVLQAEEAPLPQPGRGKIRGMKRNALVWRVFSQLSEPERKKMQELQRNNPEQFALEMRKLADQYEQQENAWRQKMLSLVEKYRKSTDKTEREKLKAEVVKMEKERFEKRLNDLERTIAATKKRVAFMEEDLKKRKARSAAIVEARVDAILSGELPVTVPPHFQPRRGPGAPGRPNFPPRRTPGFPPPGPGNFSGRP